MASRTMMTQKKKDLKDQYQVADLREYDVMHIHTTAYPMRRAVMGEQWSEKLGSKQISKSTPPSPVEKISTSEIVDTEEEIQFKRPVIIMDETVIEEQSLGSKKGSKEQGTPEQMPERSYVGYYEGTIGLFEKLVMVISSKKEGVEGLEVPSTWPPSLVYGITPSASSDDDKCQQIELES